MLSEFMCPTRGSTFILSLSRDHPCRCQFPPAGWGTELVGVDWTLSIYFVAGDRFTTSCFAVHGPSHPQPPFCSLFPSDSVSSRDGSIYLNYPDISLYRWNPYYIVSYRWQVSHCYSIAWDSLSDDIDVSNLKRPFVGFFCFMFQTRHIELVSVRDLAICWTSIYLSLFVWKQHNKSHSNR